MFYNLGEFLTVNFLYSSLAFALAILLLSVRNLWQIKWTDKKELILLLISQVGILFVSYLIKEFNLLLMVPFLANIFLLLIRQSQISEDNNIRTYSFGASLRCRSAPRSM